MKPTIASRLTVLALAILALVFGTGCEDLSYYTDLSQPSTYFYVLCSDAGVLTAYFQSEQFGAAPQVLWTKNIGDCSKSTDLIGREFSLSEASSRNIISGFHSGSSRGPSNKASSSSQNSLIDIFVNLVPLPFGPPVRITNQVCGGDIHAFLVNHTNGTVTDVGMCPQPTTTVIPVGSNPLQVAMTPDGATALVTRYDNAVVWIDAATDQVTFTLQTGDVYPSGIAISPDGTRAYVTNYYNPNQSLLVIDVVNRAILTTIPLGPAYPRSLAITPDGSQVWVNYLNQSEVDIVDTLTLTVTAGITLSGTVSTGMAFNPTGTEAFIATFPNLLTIVDTATLRTIATVTVGASPIDVILTPDGRSVFVTSDPTPVVSVVDAHTNLLLQSLPVNGGSMGLVVFPANMTSQ